MLDWNKKPEQQTEAAVSTPVDKKEGRRKSWFLRTVIGVIGLYFIVSVFVGMYWSMEPDMFPVQSVAQQAAQQKGQQLVTGYTTIETVKRVAGTLLNKPGGFISNDYAPPGLWLDNMPSWEYGVLVQIRDFSRALRKDFARSQSQSTEDPALRDAEPKFQINHKSWMLPAAESEYRDGIKLLEQYQSRLADSGQAEAVFFARADNLNSWLDDASTRLGSLSQRLSASVGRVRLDTALHDAPEVEDLDIAKDGSYQTPWLQIDNVFYEARGQAWALAHLLRAVEVDFADVLEKKNATVVLRQIIRELEASQETLWSPMVLNGDGFGILANHSLVMANYISRANAGLIDLHRLLSQG